MSLAQTYTNSSKSSNIQNKRTIDVLLFMCGGDLMAVRTTHIRSLWNADYQASAPASHLPPRVAEAFSGWIEALEVPVFKLHSLLGYSATSDPNHIILFEEQGISIGLLVEKIFEVQSVKIETIELLPPIIEKYRERQTTWAFYKLENQFEIEQGLSWFEEGYLVNLLNFSALFDQAEQNAIIM